MLTETLYEHFRYAIEHNGTDLDLLRSMVQDVTNIKNKMPDKVLLNVFGRELFAGKIEIPTDKHFDTIEHFADIEDLFKI